MEFFYITANYLIDKKPIEIVDFDTPIRVYDKSLQPVDISLMDIYKEQVTIWYLDRVDQLETMEHAGFIALFPVLAFFDAHAEFLYSMPLTEKKRSKKLFTKCFVEVMSRNPSEMKITSSMEDIASKQIYGSLRNGLFHNAMLEGKLVIRQQKPDGTPAPAIEEIGKTIYINPYRLNKCIRNYFEYYLQRLATDQNYQHKFIARWRSLIYPEKEVKNSGSHSVFPVVTTESVVEDSIGEQNSYIGLPQETGASLPNVPSGTANVTIKDVNKTD